MKKIILKDLSDKILRFAFVFEKIATKNNEIDIEDAFNHLRISTGLPNQEDFPLALNMFDLTFDENFNLHETDDDFGSWPEWELDELKDLSEEELHSELSYFRGKNWANRAMKWRADGYPPIIIIKAGNFNEISDGRGRTSMALGLGLMELPAIILTLKDPSKIENNIELKNHINELIKNINTIYNDTSQSMKH